MVVCVKKFKEMNKQGRSTLYLQLYVHWFGICEWVYIGEYIGEAIFNELIIG